MGDDFRDFSNEPISGGASGAASGPLAVSVRHWRAADGGRRMAGGGWRAADGGRRMAGAKGRTDGIGEVVGNNGLEWPERKIGHHEMVDGLDENKKMGTDVRGVLVPV
jgi:hypothetical protein